MAPPAIEESLRRAEAAVADGEGLAGTGFWSAVANVKREPELVDRYAERIAAIDTEAHRAWALVTVPLWIGTTVMVIAAAAGLVLVGWAYFLDDPSATISFLLGVGVLVGASHTLAHLVVGRLFGMRFTSMFIGGVTQPQPGVKVDYATYLSKPPRKRAWMHASGALVTKAIPLVMIGSAIAADLPTWVAWGLLALSVVMIVTDVLWSTQKSDWKKFKREMEFAQRS